MSAERTGGERKNAPGFHFEIFLVALAVILLEISYTRVFSFKLYYYFTYLIIGIALLGLGSGGVVLSLLPRAAGAPTHRLIAAACSLAGIAVPISYAAVARIQLNTSLLTTEPVELLKLAAVCLFLFAPFFLAGLAITAILAARPERVSRLYAADLLGAALGSAMVIWLISNLGPPATILLSGLVFALASVRLALRDLRLGLVPTALGAAAAVAALLQPGWIPEPVPDVAKRMAPQRLEGDAKLLHSEWGSVFRVDVLAHPDDGEVLPGVHLLVHDGTIGSTVTRWDGDPKSTRFFDTEALAVPFSLLSPEPSVLIIGAAGGREVLASLHFGASEITGVELNPTTVELMTGRFAELSGGIMADPRVTLVNAEGRSFVDRLDRSFDLIWLVAPDSYAAMNASTSAAFVLSESYLYTQEMIESSFEHLAEDGILCAEFADIDFANRPKRSVRYLATAREALAEMGIEDFEKHVMLGTTPGFFFPPTIILLKRTPFSEEEIAAFRGKLAEIDALKAGPEADPSRREQDYWRRGVAWHSAGGPVDVSGANPVNRVIANAGAESDDWLETYPYDASAVTDDAPFFWHFVSFRDALLGAWGTAGGDVRDWEEATGERVLLVMLAFAAVFAAAMLLLPAVAARAIWRELPHKRNVTLYFLALGLGFMFFEVSLIQRLTLFLGYPTYSVTVTLFAVLVSTGLGSLWSARVQDRPRALRLLFVALIPLMLWCQFGLEPAMDALAGLELGGRVVACTIFVAPLGLCLGAFMPLGLSIVSEASTHSREYVAWAWAVNGFGSVVGSILAAMLAMSFGFQVLFGIAVLVYAAGIFALTRGFGSVTTRPSSGLT